MQKKRLDFWKDNEHKGSFRGRSNSLKQLTTILESNTMLHANREGVFILQLGWAFPYTAQALPLSWWPFHTNSGRGTFFLEIQGSKESYFDQSQNKWQIRTRKTRLLNPSDLLWAKNTTKITWISNSRLATLMIKMQKWSLQNKCND